MSFEHDVVVIGGGHAGTEAANAAARLGARVLLVTSNLDTVGQMSCNPAIGGIAKGTVVREVDALGGVMGRAADLATIQFRMLNRSKGPAVWAPRAQCDRVLYRRAVRSILEGVPGLTLCQGTVRALLLDGGKVAGVAFTDGRTVRARSVIVTAGTFLRGRIHIGTEVRVSGGRAGDPAVIELAEQLEATGLAVARFKTGTPPRIDGRTVNYRDLERQDGEMPSYRFSHYQRSVRPEQRPCWITWAGDPVKDIVRTNLNASALYGGAIAGRGPRYCPSIEDKIVKFPNAPRHQVFLEPEGLDTSELYVNGLSTSLPLEVQESMLHAIPGLERAVMTRAGYAIEYDFYPPHQLTPWLEVRSLTGLFFAGQINGTTGYEEAAAQGVVAGINAARTINEREPVVLPRNAAYIGVLTDDLVSRGVDEPYRLFTSRAEFRLLLRQDNAVRRLAPIAIELGLLGDDERATVSRRLGAEQYVQEQARSRTISPELANPILAAAGERAILEPVRIAELAKRPRVSLAALLSAAAEGGLDSDESMVTSEIELKYSGYIERELVAAQEFTKLLSVAIPGHTCFEQMQSLSMEAREKLTRARPDSLGRAARIPGVSPSDLQNLVMELAKLAASQVPAA